MHTGMYARNSLICYSLECLVHLCLSTPLMVQVQAHDEISEIAPAIEDMINEIAQELRELQRKRKDRNDRNL